MTRIPILPSLPRPNPIRANEPDSWASYTVRQRQPAILRQVLADNDYPPTIVARVRRYLDALPDMAFRPLTDQDAPDAAAWNGILQSVEGRSWLEAPWLVQEFAFYRYLLEAVGYFEPGSACGQDPYAVQKRQSLLEAAASIEKLARRSAGVPATGQMPWEELARHLALSLWGNQADLSMWPAGQAGGGPQHSADSVQAAHTLVDHRPTLRQWLRARSLPLGRLDIIVDNAGMELVSDLMLTDFVLGSGLAWLVRLHLKAYPTFVSDAFPRDVTETLAWLVAEGGEATRALGRRLSSLLRGGRLQLAENDFWNLPLAFWDMPGTLRAELSQADLVISKGDANYRRLFGDLHWPLTTPLDVVVGTVPGPLVALRTLKSELAIGLTPAQVRLLAATEPGWLTSGRWGVIQFLPAAATS
jgi:uncharacterized protein with ATP-grasp and redox domains